MSNFEPGDREFECLRARHLHFGRQAGDLFRRGGRVERTLRTPEDYGLSRCAPEDLAGGDAAHNAQELTRVFTGEDRGPHRDALVMSTSLVLEVQGTAGDAMHGVELANAALDEGNAADLLTRLRTHFDNR